MNKGRLVQVFAVGVATAALKVWLRAAKLAVNADVPFVPAPFPQHQEVCDPSDPLDEIDQTEIVSIVRRWDGDEGSVYVDCGEMDTDMALALMLRGLFNLLLEESLPVEADGED